MCLADVAWQSIDTTTIRNCWRKSGILPETFFEPPAMSPSVPVSMLLNSDPVDAAEHAEKNVSNGLDELERMGLIQPRNKMNIAELLNPESEQKLVDDISDKEIFEAVTNSCKAA